MVENEAADDRFVSAGEQVIKQRESVTPELTAARLTVMRQVQQVIKNGLSLLGISAPDRM
jgi:arginyl-tRNA synthetase